MSPGRSNFPEASIMVVDDDRSNLRFLEALLRHAGYSSVHATSDPLTVETAYDSVRPDLLVLDVHMPGLDGFALMSRLRAQLDRDLVPILVLTGDPSPGTVEHALSSGAREFVAKPFERVELLLRVSNLLETRFAQVALRDHNVLLERKVAERTEELANAELATLQLLARAAEFRDDATGRHTQRVGHLSAQLASRLSLPAAEVELIRLAAPLHDIGKIGIPDSILSKPAALTAEERAMMERHTTIGGEILSTQDFAVLRAAREIALFHHERWDGAGYPHGMAGSAIPHAARIVAVADVFDALTHDRPYRAAMAHDAVTSLMAGESGTHLDPTVVDALISLEREGALREPT